MEVKREGFFGCGVILIIKGQKKNLACSSMQRYKGSSRPRNTFVPFTHQRRHR